MESIISQVEPLPYLYSRQSLLKITRQQHWTWKVVIKYVVTIPGKHTKFQPGMEVVDFNWVASKEPFSIPVEDVNEVALEDVN